MLESATQKLRSNISFLSHLCLTRSSHCFSCYSFTTRSTAPSPKHDATQLSNVDTGSRHVDRCSTALVWSCLLLLFNHLNANKLRTESNNKEQCNWQWATSPANHHDDNISVIPRRNQSTLRLSQIVFHLFWLQPPKSILVTDADLDVIFRHLSFKALLQRQYSSLNGIFQPDVIAVPAVWPSIRHTHS